MADDRLDAETFGSGPDIVFLHSLLTDRSSFVPFAERLTRERRVTLLNLPGFGDSPAGEPLGGYAERIVAFCRGLGTRPDIIGNGLGSFVAMIAAARHSEQIGRIALLGAAVAFPEPGRLTFRALAERAEREGMAAIADAAITRMLNPDFVAAHPGIAADRKAVFMRIEPAVFAAAARSLATLDLSDEVKRVRNPVLIVAGEKDGATPPALGRELAARLPDARFVELPGVGHAPHIHAPELLIETLRPFLGLG